MVNFCTLFDSNYLDKALAMYNSLQAVCADYKLYIMCFDDTAYSVLNDMALENIVLAKLSEFETPELLSVKDKRSKAEYCWTCTPAVIDYFMSEYELDNLTYIDADLYFFSDPTVLVDEIKQHNAHIGIMEHRFDESQQSDTAGKYCVEFNYFDNTECAVKALKWWKDRCLEWCYNRYEPATEDHCERYGDQKYLEQFEILFEGVHSVSHLGSGLAPWNVWQYDLVANSGNDGIILRHKRSGKEIPLVFYHYQNLKYISPYKVNINSHTRDKKLKYAIYFPYLLEVTKAREVLRDKYNIELAFRKSYSSNKLKAFIQKYIMPYKFRYLSDIVNIKKIMRRQGD